MRRSLIVSLSIFAALSVALSVPAFGDDGSTSGGLLVAQPNPTTVVPTGPPDWAMSFSPTQLTVATSDGSSADAIQPEAVGGYCEGSATIPYDSKNVSTNKWGIGYTAEQQCEGDFDAQSVCIRLQEKDSAGSWYARTTWRCADDTTGEWPYASGWVSCAAAEHGTFRSRSRGWVDTPYGPETAYYNSASKVLC